MFRGVWSCVAVVGLSACEGVIGGAILRKAVPEPVEPFEATCDISQFPNARVEAIALEFAERIHPVMTEGDSSCVSCHSADARRIFTVTADGAETFYRARAAGFFDDKPGSLLARLSSTDPSTVMPQGLPRWSTAQLEAVARIACELQALESTGAAKADEEFPPELLMPFTGTKSTSYDNSFINFVQLKGKVKAMFGDDWVRGGVDQWERTIGLFGGVNFKTHFVEARAATPEFLLGLDALAPDVCGKAAAAKTGPFTGVDVTTGVVDIPASSTRAYEMETVPVVPATGVGRLSTNPAGYFCYTNCTFAVDVDLPAAGTYQVVVRAKAQNDSAGNGPKISAVLGAGPSVTLLFSNETAFEEKTATFQVSGPGRVTASIGYINDYNNPPPSGGDRNVTIDRFQVVGPLGAGTGTTRVAAAKASLDTLHQRLLLRPASPAELTSSYALLTDLTDFGSITDAWSGVCEALLRHPDFLFTLPPSADTATGDEKQKALLVSLTQSLTGRPPTAAEFELLAQSGFAAVVDAVLASPDFRTYYFGRIQLRIESQGTPTSDEPARLWTWVATTGQPFWDILAADYTVDEAFTKQARPPEHGRTGVLTMKGYLSNKPGLPHYNFPARVLSGFMGSIFEVPPEVFDQRGTATATSTVDASSACFSCHQLLTPLALQRQKWADDGTYREVDDQGVAIDDSDHQLVPTYPYMGRGLEAFSTKAIRKEAFIRRMLNTHFKLLMGRDLRHLDDERTLYKTLWDTSLTSNGDLRAVLKAVALSDTFQRTSP